MPQRRTYQQIGADFERGLARFVIDKLEKAPTLSRQLEERIHPEVRKRLVETYGRFPDEPSEYLTIGQCVDVMMFKENWMLFKDAFVGGKFGFPNKDSFLQAIAYVSEHRNLLKHGRAKYTLKPGYSDEQMRDVYFDKLNNCLAEAVQNVSASPPTALIESR